jgi:hypothetical protein
VDVTPTTTPDADRALPDAGSRAVAEFIASDAFEVAALEALTVGIRAVVAEDKARGRARAPLRV